MKKIYLLIFTFLFCSTLLIAQNTVIIQVSNFVYTPKNVTVKTGDIVRFQWVAGNHPTQSDDNTTMPVFPMNSLNQTKDFVFTSAQVIPYFCQPHIGLGMVGVITVENKSVGISSVKFLPNLKIYPNPASKEFFANVSLKSNSVLFVKLIDLLGKEVLDLGSYELSAGSHTISLNLEEGIRKGLYFVKFEDRNNTALAKLSVE